MDNKLYHFIHPLEGTIHMNKTKRIRYTAALLLAAAVGGLLFWAIGARPEPDLPDQRGDADLRLSYEGQRVFSDGTYIPRKGLTTILVMGVDQRQDAQADGARGGGQTDFLQLLVIDSMQKTVSRLPLDRDTMTEITVLGVLGNEAGSRVSQLCLAHGFGDGREGSCKLTVDAVSRLLLDAPIDDYLAMNLDGISVLNDYLGGVTVTLEDDFSDLDPAMTPGTTLTLRGDQAEYYVRTRRTVGDGTNEARMARQEAYLSQLSQLLRQRLNQGQEEIRNLLEAVSDYLVTDLAEGTAVNTAWLCRDYTVQDIPPIQGEHKLSAFGYMQFFPDESSVEETVKQLFYRKQN